MVSKQALTLAVAATLVSGATILRADTVAGFKAALNTTPVSDTVSGAIVTGVIPFAAGATSKSFFIQDSTGALEAFSVPTSIYNPVVGDAIDLTGLSETFHGLYESHAPAAPGAYTITVDSSGNTVPAPTAFTTAEFQSTFGPSLQNEFGTLSNVTFAAPGTTIASGGTYVATDGTLNVNVFVPANNPLIGSTLPSGAVNIFGYYNEFDSVPAANTPPDNTGHELAPLSFSAVQSPEPASIGLLGMASCMFLGRRRK